MKKYLSQLITIVISCMLIACTVFFTTFGEYGEKIIPVNEEVSAKISGNDTDSRISVNKLDTIDAFNKIKSGNSAANTGASTPAATSEAASSTTSATAKSTTTVRKTSATTKKTSAPATTTTVKAPEDDSKNAEYIKDPDYKSKYYIVVYTGSQSAVVYGKDSTGAYTVKVKAFTVSTGKKSTPTRKGLYKIRAQYRWRLLMGPCYGQYSSSIGSGYLFHSVPYDKQKPDTLYNASYNNLGKAVSHGCIRMCVRDCKWIYDNCPIGTQVHVVWASGPKGAGVPKRKSGAKYSGWDPSDKWSKGNPYFENTENSKTTKITSKTTESTTETTKKSTTASSSSAPSTSKTTTASTSKTSAASTTAPSVSSTQDPAPGSSDQESDQPVG